MRIAFFIPPMQGHLQPAQVLAQALTARGHQCFLVCHPDVEAKAAGWERLVIDAARCDWTPQDFIRHARRPGFPFGIRHIVNDMVKITNSLCQLAPDLLAAAGIDAVVSDQMEPAGALVADHLNLPYISFAAAHPINREPTIPLSVLSWRYEDSQAAIRRNQGGEWIANQLTGTHDRTIAQWSAHWGLKPRRRLVDCLSPLADISQMFQKLDFPRRELPDTFHYVGPLRGAPTMALSGTPDNDPRPLVYASLGTLQGHRLKLLRRIARACRSLDVRLIVTHGGALTAQEAATIDADFVLPWASQTETLARASAVITHAGLNTVLDALIAGVPMLCLPLAFEQPGISARVVRAGAGEKLSPHASAASIAQSLDAILTEPRYRQAASAIGQDHSATHSAEQAAQIAEQALSTKLPVRTGRLLSQTVPI